MNIKIKKLVDWDIVFESALYTQGKKNNGVFPSEKWKYKACKAQHSPLRCLLFAVYIENVPNFVLNHLVRHVHAQPYIQTMREDLTGISSDDITRNTLNSGMFIVNAQEMINISNVRLCVKASFETMIVWKEVIFVLSAIEPILAKFCVPNCVKLGYCPEFKTCGYVLKNERKRYIEMLGGEIK